jgi:branched-chain amino acid transport system substrate-binding protein
LKRVIFLTIGILLVLGLVLPGCGTVVPPTEEKGLTVKIAIAGPMGYIQGDNMWYGAEMAVDELGTQPLPGGRNLTIQLMKVDTQEINPPSANYPGQQVTNAISNGADFVIGGFRTEGTIQEVEAAMDAQTMMFICGSATGSILAQVNQNYDRYKYLFRSQPLNESFLFIDCVMMLGMLGSGYLAAIHSTNTSLVRVAFVAEDLEWTVSPRAVVQQYIGALHYTYAGTVECSDTATDLSTQMNELKAMHPTIIFTFLSGPVGITYGKAQADTALQVPAVTVGINVESQDPNYWSKCTGDAANNGADGQITLMTWAPNIEQTSKTGPFLDAWAAAHPTSPLPIYTAATYDIIKGLVVALQDTVTIDTTSDAPVFSYDDLIAWYEDPANVQLTTSGKAGYYTTASQPLVTAGVPCFAHDLIYGPQMLATGLGVEWEDDGTGNGKLVGVWPNATFAALNQALCPFNAALGLDWTGFTFPGMEMFKIPNWVLAAWAAQ